MGAAAAEADRTLFVGNLDPKVTEELIFELFHQAGPVIKVKIPKDRDGRPKQFAFVNFKHEESVPYGLNLLNGIKLYGRPIRIQFRAGSSHASQDGHPGCSPHGAAGSSPSPHPTPSSGRYVPGRYESLQHRTPSRTWHVHESLPSWFSFQAQFGLSWTCMPLVPQILVQREQHCVSIEVWNRCEEGAARSGRAGAHPYQPGREQRCGERGHDFWGGFEERGYRGGREEPPYDERHRDGWSHDYDYRREGYREARWHPARH
ncbi:RBM7 protein, partial [Crotophaga sulcirostris]|nr:RBM7 protein [Crotophaga sulcirostris]